VSRGQVACGQVPSHQKLNTLAHFAATSTTIKNVLIVPAPGDEVLVVVEVPLVVDHLQEVELVDGRLEEIDVRGQRRQVLQQSVDVRLLAQVDNLHRGFRERGQTTFKRTSFRRSDNLRSLWDEKLFFSDFIEPWTK